MRLPIERAWNEGPTVFVQTGGSMRMRQELKPEHYRDVALRKLAIRGPPGNAAVAAQVAEKICLAVDQAKGQDREWGIDFPSLGGKEPSKHKQRQRRREQMSEGPKLKMKVVLAGVDLDTEDIDYSMLDAYGVIKQLSALQYTGNDKQQYDYFNSLKLTGGQNNTADLELEFADIKGKGSDGKRKLGKKSKTAKKKIDHGEHTFAAIQALLDTGLIRRILSWEPM